MCSNEKFRTEVNVRNDLVWGGHFISKPASSVNGHKNRKMTCSRDIWGAIYRKTAEKSPDCTRAIFVSYSTNKQDTVPQLTANPASRYFQNKWETSPGLKSSHPLITLLRVQTILTLLCWLQRTANLDQKLCVLQWLDGNLNTWPFANSIWFIQSLALVSSSVLMKEIFSCKVPPYTR